jgi:hypothetical protein
VNDLKKPQSAGVELRRTLFGSGYAFSFPCPVFQAECGMGLRGFTDLSGTKVFRRLEIEEIRRIHECPEKFIGQSGKAHRFPEKRLECAEVRYGSGIPNRSGQPRTCSGSLATKPWRILNRWPTLTGILKNWLRCPEGFPSSGRYRSFSPKRR